MSSKTALRDAAGWRDAGAPMSVAVNISVTLLTQAGFVEEVQAALEHSGMPATSLTLEVTESAAMTSSDAALAALERLRDLGIKLSVDDYGTGQSTLTYLKRLPQASSRSTKASSRRSSPTATMRSSSARRSTWRTSLASASSAKGWRMRNAWKRWRRSDATPPKATISASPCPRPHSRRLRHG
jgi:hypothetical protein